MNEVSGTRTMRDWQVAGDIGQRSLRHGTLALKKHAASLGKLPSMVSDQTSSSFTCPLARGPLGEELRVPLRPSSANRHKRKVRQVYRLMDPERDGAVRLDQLRQSFQVMSVAMDDETFDRYAKDLLRSSKPDCTVAAGDFKNFHKQVWGNQPALLRWQASTGGQRSMTSVSSAPSLGASGMRTNEGILRKAFAKYCDARSNLLVADKVPAILQDLGLPSDLLDGMAATDPDGALGDLEEELTFHQTVMVVNKCIAAHEASRLASASVPTPNKVTERLEAALQFSSAMDDDDSSADEEEAVKDEARLALEAALLGIDDDEDIRREASLALEAALLGGDDEEDGKAEARAALEMALLGFVAGEDDDEERELKSQASEALEAALLG